MILQNYEQQRYKPAGGITNSLVIGSEKNSTFNKDLASQHDARLQHEPA